jgi:prephenate dehydrogenase
MKIQIAIIGLGQIGCSMGQALAKYTDNILRVGHDKSRDAATHAKETDAVDKITITLSGAVENADIVLLALPLQEIKPVLEHISQDLKEDALVIDTAPLKVPVLRWADELLPPGRHYIGFTPVIHSDYLEEEGSGHQVAHPDLFEGTLMGIVSGKGAGEKELGMASNLAQLLGAQPYFSDPIEMDGLMTVAHVLPQLLAASLLKTSQETPGWREIRKIAGKAYSDAGRSFGQDEISGALAAALLHNRENITRVIDELIDTLVEIRDLPETAEQEALTEIFEGLQRERDLWLDDRRKGRWGDIPQSNIQRVGILSQLLGFRPARKPGEKK